MAMGGADRGEMGCDEDEHSNSRLEQGHVRRASWAPRTFFTFLARAKNVKTPPRGRAKNVKLNASTKTSPTLLPMRKHDEILQRSRVG